MTSPNGLRPGWLSHYSYDPSLDPTGKYHQFINPNNPNASTGATAPTWSAGGVPQQARGNDQFGPLGPRSNHPSVAIPPQISQGRQFANVQHLPNPPAISSSANPVPISSSSQPVVSTSTATASAVQASHGHAPITGTNVELINLYKMIRESKGANPETLRGHCAMIGHFGDWCTMNGRGTLADVLNSGRGKEALNDWMVTQPPGRRHAVNIFLNEFSSGG